MTDDLTVTGASSDSDVGSAVASPSSEDERIIGLQRAVSAKAQEAAAERARAAALEAEIERYRLASMSDEDRAGYLTDREKAHMRSLESENERLRLAQRFPDVAPHFETIYNAKSAEEQMAYLHSLLSPTAPATTPVAPFPDVDMNNPMRSPGEGISVPPNVVLNESDADRILANWGNRPMRGR